MSLTRFTDNVSYISNLDDKPSISADELKRLFDKGSETIKRFINEVLIPEVEKGTTEIVNNLTTGGTTKALSAEMGKKLDAEKQEVIGYGTIVPELKEGQIFIQIFDD